MKIKTLNFLLLALACTVFACRKNELQKPEESFIEFYYNDTLVHFRKSFITAENDTLPSGKNIYILQGKDGKKEFDIIMTGVNLATSYEFNQYNVSKNYFSYSDLGVVITNSADTAQIKLQIENIDTTVNATFSGFASEYFSKRPINITRGKIKNISLIHP
ncbi:MAG: hypothetical protein ABI091_12560 [Ferruginibacter sp.]